MYKKLSIIFISLLSVHKAYAEPFKLGVILPLSGPVAPFGEAAKSGLEMSGKDDPQSVIEYIFEDSRYDPKTSITAFNKLSDIDKPDLIISWGTGPSGAIAPIAEARKIPTILISLGVKATKK